MTPPLPQPSFNVSEPVSSSAEHRIKNVHIKPAGGGAHL